MPNYRRIFIDNSYVFITIVMNNRRFILINNVAVLQASIEDAKKVYDFEIYAYVILPEHLHLILIPDNIKEYPKIIRAIKYNFSKKIKAGGIAIPPYDHKNIAIWQDRYWEHTIIDEEDFHKHIDYIHFNPVKHNYIKAVKDWEYSSFGQFVKMGSYESNWGSMNDVLHIKEMDLG